jgi:hypothetical protein
MRPQAGYCAGWVLFLIVLAASLIAAVIWAGAAGG